MKSLALSSLLLVFVLGCGGSVQKTPAETFCETQSGINTPYGKVVDCSGTDNSDGTITFETTQGVRMNVSVQETEAGQRYGTPTIEEEKQD